MTEPRTVPAHGTRARYESRNPEIRCRAACCRAAHAAYHRAYRAKLAERRPLGRQLRLPLGK